MSREVTKTKYTTSSSGTSKSTSRVKVTKTIQKTMPDVTSNSNWWMIPKINFPFFSGKGCDRNLYRVPRGQWWQWLLRIRTFGSGQVSGWVGQATPNGASKRYRQGKGQSNHLQRNVFSNIEKPYFFRDLPRKPNPIPARLPALMKKRKEMNLPKMLSSLIMITERSTASNHWNLAKR